MEEHDTVERGRREARLTRRAKRGDAEAFAHLMESCEDALWRCALAITRNEHDAADAVQETVLACWRGMGTLRQPRYFRTWATRIAINKSRDIAKRRANRAPLSPDDEGAAAPEPTAPDEIAQADWRILLDSLPEEQRLLILLRYVEGYRVAEIAELLGIPARTASSRLEAARNTYEKLIVAKEASL